MNFFLDNNVPPNWAACLSASSRSQFADEAVGDVVHLKGRFAANTPDVDWIQALNTPDVDWIQALASEKNWTILSGDAFRKGNGVERKILQKSGLRAQLVA